MTSREFTKEILGECVKLIGLQLRAEKGSIIETEQC